MDIKYVTRPAARYQSQLTSFYSTLHVFVGLDSLHRKGAGETFGDLPTLSSSCSQGFLALSSAICYLCQNKLNVGMQRGALERVPAAPTVSHCHVLPGLLQSSAARLHSHPTFVSSSRQSFRSRLKLSSLPHVKVPNGT